MALKSTSLKSWTTMKSHDVADWPRQQQKSCISNLDQIFA